MAEFIKKPNIGEIPSDVYNKYLYLIIIKAINQIIKNKIFIYLKNKSFKIIFKRKYKF